jgi:hypothetical protein
MQRNSHSPMYLSLQRTRPGIPQSLMSVLAGILLLAGIGAARADVNFSTFDTPLDVQITDHIREKVSARLGEGVNTRDRFFIIPFAYQNSENDPEFSHSFMTVIRVFADGAQPRLTKGLKIRKYKNREFEAFTISWLPSDFDKNPNLCVFEGIGARLVASANKCPVSPGHSFTLEQTLKMAVNAKVAVGMWGPYEIKKPGFDLAVKRRNLLNGGTIKYRADDRGYRKERVAINCFHAMAGLDKLFPNGGLFGTGFLMWGLNGTRRVLIEYEARAKENGILLEPIDPKKDLYGFVYAPNRNTRGVYDPFKGVPAHAYHR